MKHDILLTRLAMAVSAVALVLGLASLVHDVANGPQGLTLEKVALVAVFCLALLSLFYGNVVYQLTRIGQIRRRSNVADDEAADLEAIHGLDAAPTVGILIPSYKEQIPVVMQTVLSAALADYPNRRVTLLVDDPPSCSGADLETLMATRELVTELNDMFAAAAEPFRAAAEDYETRAESRSASGERDRLAALYEQAAMDVEAIGRRYAARSNPAFAHADEVFFRDVIDSLAGQHRGRADSIRSATQFDAARIRREYRRLASLFAVPVGAFERKRFANLSHAPNKAMNLNSYIGLMGGTFRIRRGAEGDLLVKDGSANDADVVVPAADYIITIDADSIIRPDYVLKLVAVLEADRGIAIAQTPYSAYPNAPSALERVAGATTDIQYLVHQGFTAFGATFWVGANAVLRREALDDIRTTAIERGHEVPVFIQDKTLIEDTGSTIDLAAKGWRLYNHPERLAYSATPPDFGALVIQRHRWANGGLIIFPNLLELWLRRKGPRAGALETFVRSHYLLSPALANIGLLLLLAVPFGRDFSNVWFPVAAAPYYLLYGRDLKQSGYRWRDLLRVYALTLLLVPVNLAGVYRSLEQMATGRKSPFARTPKIEGRTAAPASHLIALLALTTTAIASAAVNLWSANYLFFAFSAINAGFFLYGMIGLIGWRAAITDVRAGLAQKLSTGAAKPARQLAEQSNL